MNDRPPTDLTTGVRQRLVLPPEDVARLRVAAAHAGQSMHEFSRAAVLAALEAAEKKLQKKQEK